MKSLKLVLGVAALFVVAVGCHAKPSATGDDASAKADATKTGPEVVEPGVIKVFTAGSESCPIENGRLVNCPGAIAFRDVDAGELEGETGDVVLFSLLIDPSERHRLLAISRPMHDAPGFFSTKDNAERLLGQLERETNADVRDYLVERAGQIDLEKLGLVDRLKAIAASKDAAVRRAVAGKLLVHEGSAKREELVGSLLADPDEKVRQAAAGGLFGAAMSGRSDGTAACVLLTDALDGEHADDVVWRAASSSRCIGLQPRALGYVLTKTAKLETVTNRVGIDYALAIGAVCESKDPELRKLAYDAALRLSSAAVHDPSTRVAATRRLGPCDPVRAKAALTKLSTDKVPSVAEEAKTSLAKLTAAAK